MKRYSQSYCKVALMLIIDMPEPYRRAGVATANPRTLAIGIARARIMCVIRVLHRFSIESGST
jgi:hypothetical protein